ncbi:MAG: four helix bundle protein [Planctomycetes bacterium RBG_16_64_10]|nr:MAG: four helix bundle protein [Planctomycetes bacterium RBG_16_64_10]
MKRPNEPSESRAGEEGLIPRHGGYRNLKTFQLAEMIYDVTVRFCERFIDPRSRTHDQMVQAARSGRQNIAEGSMDSATSKKIELKLTGVARGSLEELRLDYEDYLRQRGLPKWEPGHPVLVRFRARRCANLDQFRAWVAEEVVRGKEDTDEHRRPRTDSKVRSGVGVGPCPSVFVANGVLSLLNLCIHLLKRQMEAQAAAFEKEGGFTERLYRRRTQARRDRRD